MTMESFYAGGFLYSVEHNAVLLHKRDANTEFNPNKWAFFGGLCHKDEKPVDCFVREIEEELGLSIKAKQALALTNYLNEELNTHRHVFYVERYVPKEQLVLGEGADFGWVSLERLGEFELTEKTARDLELFKKKLCI